MTGCKRRAVAASATVSNFSVMFTYRRRSRRVTRQRAPLHSRIDVLATTRIRPLGGDDVVTLPAREEFVFKSGTVYHRHFLKSMYKPKSAIGRTYANASSVGDSIERNNGQGCNGISQRLRGQARHLEGARTIWTRRPSSRTPEPYSSGMVRLGETETGAQRKVGDLGLLTRWTVMRRNVS